MNRLIKLLPATTRVVLRRQTNVPSTIRTACFSDGNRNLPELTLFSKTEGCSLCDDAKEVLIKHCHRFVYNEVDITAEGNEHWFELYKYDIPVVHVDGTEIMRHKVFEDALLDSLEIAAGRK